MLAPAPARRNVKKLVTLGDDQLDRLYERVARHGSTIGVELRAVLDQGFAWEDRQRSAIRLLTEPDHTLDSDG